MGKWADYCIVEVHYGTDPAVIEEVKARPDTGESLGAEQSMSRRMVVNKIEDGTTFVTVYKGADGKWNKGESVAIVKIDNTKYLRTDANKIKKDNLGKLPQY